MGTRDSYLERPRAAWSIVYGLHVDSSSGWHSICTDAPFMQTIPTSCRVETFSPHVSQGLLSQMMILLLSITRRTMRSSFDSLLAISAIPVTFILSPVEDRLIGSWDAPFSPALRSLGGTAS